MRIGLIIHKVKFYPQLVVKFREQNCIWLYIGHIYVVLGFLYLIILRYYLTYLV